MIQDVKIIANELLHDQKVANHFVPIELFSLKGELYFSRVTMWKSAFARMLRQHVATFDVDCLVKCGTAFFQQIDLPLGGKRKLNVGIATGTPMVLGLDPTGMTLLVLTHLLSTHFPDARIQSHIPA